jgi:hypothetical protein
MSSRIVSRLACALAALALAACGSSPTEPTASTLSPSLTLAVTLVAVPSTSGGVLSVFHDACGCAAPDVQIRVNEQIVGQVSTCGTTTGLPFSVSSGTIRVTAYGHTLSGQPLVAAGEGVMFVNGDAVPLSMTVRLGCSSK